MIWWFVGGVIVGLPFGFTVALCRMAQQADEDAGLTAGMCEHPGCNRPWTTIVDLSPTDVRWVCDLHVHATVEAYVSPFEAFGVPEKRVVA